MSQNLPLLTLTQLKDHAHVYLTLAHIALDVLPPQASSVLCKWLFSGSKQVATNPRACLGLVLFEELTIIKSAWGPRRCDITAWNAMQTEDIAMFEFEEMLVDDVDFEKWDESLPGMDSDWL